jgi:hypothetical protein
MGHRERQRHDLRGERHSGAHLADDCVWEANTRGITEAALIEAAGGDLNAYMLAKLNRAVGREVKDRVARGQILN